MGGDVFSVLLGQYLAVELLGHMVTLCLTFKGTVHLFFKAVVTLYILTSTI